MNISKSDYNYLTKEDGNNTGLPLDKALQIAAKKTLQEVPNTEGVYFTDIQYELYSGLSESSEFSFSGPTSMGKSFIIKAILCYTTIGIKIYFGVIMLRKLILTASSFGTSPGRRRR